MTQDVAGAPVLTVVRGDASPEEVAALVAVVHAAASGAPADTPPASEWGSPRRAVRAPLMAASDGWRASAFPG